VVVQLPGKRGRERWMKGLLLGEEEVREESCFKVGVAGGTREDRVETTSTIRMPTRPMGLSQMPTTSEEVGQRAMALLEELRDRRQT
jgi:hypothetical protein